MKSCRFTLRNKLQATAGTYVLSLLVIPLAPMATAQEVSVEEAARTLETVTVTSRFREESVQDIGASIGALSGEAMRDDNVQDFDDIAARIVGLDSVDRGPNQNDPSLRGISNNTISVTADSGRFSPLISQFFDDLPVSAATGSQKDFAMFDMDRVEVLRGPQPTLFGEGAVGGAIRYFSRNPDLGASGLNDLVLEAGLSQIDSGSLGYSVSGAGSATLVPEKLAVRGVLNYREDGGFIDYTVAGEDNANDYETVSGRLVVLAEPSENLTLRLMAMAGEDDASGGNVVDPGLEPSELQFSSPFVGKVKDKYEMFSAAVTYDFGAIEATSISSYYSRDSESLASNSALAQLFSLSATGDPASALFPETGVAYDTDDELIGQEFRFVSQFDGPLNFIAGLNYQEVNSDVKLNVDVPGFADFALAQDNTAPFFIPGGLFLIPADARDVLSSGVNEFETEQFSVFGELTFAASDDLRLIAGARYLREEITSTFVAEETFLPTVMQLFPPYLILDVGEFVDLAQVDRTQTFTLDKVLPRAAIEYDLSDDTLLYGSVSTGARNGNINLLSNVVISSTDPAEISEFIAFDEDSILSYELGAKSVLLDGALILNAAVYHSAFDDPQTTVIPRSSNLTVNAPDVDILGAEIESAWQVDDVWSAYLNVSYQDAEFTGGRSIISSDIYIGNFLAQGGDPALVPSLTPIAENDLQNGNRPINVPEWTASAGLDFSKPIGHWGADLTGGISYQYVDSRYGSVANLVSTELEPLNTINLKLGLSGENWALQGFIKNVTNEIEFSSAYGNESQTGIIRPNGDLDVILTDTAINTPRTIGVKLTLRR